MVTYCGAHSIHQIKLSSHTYLPTNFVICRPLIDKSNNYDKEPKPSISEQLSEGLQPCFAF
jgi:hypothetical protein